MSSVASTFVPGGKPAGCAGVTKHHFYDKKADNFSTWLDGPSAKKWLNEPTHTVKIERRQQASMASIQALSQIDPTGELAAIAQDRAAPRRRSASSSVASGSHAGGGGRAASVASSGYSAMASSVAARREAAEDALNFMSPSSSRSVVREDPQSSLEKAATSERWGWCNTVKDGRPPLTHHEVPVPEHRAALGKSASDPNFGPCLLSGRPGREPPGAFHGEPRQFGHRAHATPGKMRGGKLAEDGWAGTYPLSCSRGCYPWGA